MFFQRRCAKISRPQQGLLEGEALVLPKAQPGVLSFGRNWNPEENGVEELVPGGKRCGGIGSWRKTVWRNWFLEENGVEELVPGVEELVPQPFSEKHVLFCRNCLGGVSA